MCMLFAATYPERTSHLALYGTTSRFIVAEDHDWLPPREELDELAEMAAEEWAQGPLLPLFCPSLVDDESFKAWWAPYLALGCLTRRRRRAHADGRQY